MKRGFTIVEIMVVVVMITIISTIAVLGAAAMKDRAQNSDALSKIAVIQAGLEKYYRENNEYPSAQSLAANGNGRALSASQYATIASTLGVSQTVLNGEDYKFVPCAVNTSPCTVTASTDRNSIMYLTRTPADVSAGTARTFIMPSSGCDYTFPAPGGDTTQVGYTANMLVYYNPAESDPWREWVVLPSKNGKMTRGAWCWQVRL
jgi:prepilin-type N-terminal cleavage/methylation domain-containing protein